MALSLGMTVWTACGGGDEDPAPRDGSAVNPDGSPGDASNLPGTGGLAGGADGAPDGLGLPDTGGVALDGGGVGGGGGNVVNTCQGTGLAISNQPGASRAPALSWDGTQYAVVWGDARADAPGVYLARLTAAGVPVGGSVPLLVGAGSVLTKNAEIAALPAGGFVIVWEDCEAPTNDPNMPCAAWSVKSRTLDASYAPQGAVANTLSAGKAVERRPYVHTALGRTFVTYRDAQPMGGLTLEVVHVAVLDAAGAEATTPAPVVLSNPGRNTAFPYLSGNDSALALAYVVGGASADVKVALYDANLTNTADVFVRQGMPGDATNVQAAWAGDAWVLAWEDRRSGTEVVWAAQVSGDGATVSPAVALSNGNSNWPSVASDGMNAVVLFYNFPDGAQVVRQSLDANGALAGPAQGITVAGSQDARFPDVIFNGTTQTYAVVYEDRRCGEVVFQPL